MNIKLFIKNNLRSSYFIPLTVKYRAEGKREYAKKAFPVILKTRVIRGRGLKRSVSDDTASLLRCAEVRCEPGARFYYHIDESRTIAVKGNVISNFTLDYRRIIDGSFRELADQAVAAGGAYGEHAKVIKKGVYALYRRIVRYLEKEGQKEILRAFAGLLDRRAEHLEEGLQRVLFFNQILWQTRHRLNGIGRIDRFLDGLYRKDIESGYLDPDAAYALILEFLKCLHRNYEYKSAALLGDIGQIIVLGGLEEEGGYFCNDLTYLFLKAQGKLRFPDPKILLRVSEKMPEKLREEALECLLSGTGSPILSNDDVVIKSLTDFGFEKADAYDYCVSACWEPYIPGRSMDQNNMMSFDLAQVLSDYLEGTDLNRIHSFKELLTGYDRALHEKLKVFARELDDHRWAEDPLVSMFMDDCSREAKDISEGGAHYNNYGFTTVGMGSVCDSLLNIRDLCFQEKKYGLTELETAREQDYLYSGRLYEEIRALRGHFGHDDEDSIAMTGHIINRCNRTLSGIRNRLGGRIRYGLSSPDYLLAGKHSAADLAGRKRGMPYATHISADDAGLTGLIGFAAQLKYGGCNINGNVADLIVQPCFISDNREKFLMFLKGAVRRGFYQLQMNILDSATLIAAKKDPEKYKYLIVRVWGFSAYFNDLPKEYQDRLIERIRKSEECCA